MRSYIATKTLLIFALLFLFLIILIIPADYLRNPRIIGETLGIVRVLGTNAPYFDPPLTNFTLNQTAPFFFDVNCSDPDPLDIILYSENFTGFSMNTTTGVINVSGFDQSLVGNHSIQFVCLDSFGFNDTEQVLFSILDVNEPPILASIGSQIAVEGQIYTLNLSATDVDSPSLTFGATTALFTINPSTGRVSFTPTLAQIGNYTINFTVFDGELYDFEIVSFTIVRGPFCGDNACGSTETCESCPADCGTCPAAPSGGGATTDSTSSGGGGSASTTTGGIASVSSSASQQPVHQCEEKWECSEWGTCTIEGIRTRSCIDISRCNTKNDKPPEFEQCEYQPTCFDGVQNGGETGIDCGGPCEPCIIESCFDGIQNGGETGIDCGGPCKECTEKEFTKEPFLEIPGIIKIPRQFPWILLLVILCILLATFAYDRYRMHRIKKLPFEEYREEMRKYRPLRRKLFTFDLNMLLISLIAIAYIYLFSNNLRSMMAFSFIPVSLIFAIPFAVSYLIRYYEYVEYQRIKKEQHLKRTHLREILQLIRIENELLFELEKRLKEKIAEMAKRHDFDGKAELYSEINQIFQDLSVLRKKRETRISLLRVSNDILDKIIAILESKNLGRASKEYPEYYSIRKELNYIEDNKDRDCTDEEDGLLSDIEEISLPFMKVVAESDKGLSALYNALVDVHEYYVNSHELLQRKDSEIMMVERTFIDKVKGLSKKSNLMKSIQENTEFAKVYNSMVDLLNHYMKKHQLSKALDNV